MRGVLRGLYASWNIVSELVYISDAGSTYINDDTASRAFEPLGRDPKVGCWLVSNTVSRDTRHDDGWLFIGGRPRLVRRPEGTDSRTPIGAARLVGEEVLSIIVLSQLLCVGQGAIVDKDVLNSEVDHRVDGSAGHATGSNNEACR